MRLSGHPSMSFLLTTTSANAFVASSTWLENSVLISEATCVISLKRSRCFPSRPTPACTAARSLRSTTRRCASSSSAQPGPSLNALRPLYIVPLCCTFRPKETTSLSTSSWALRRSSEF